VIESSVANVMANDFFFGNLFNVRKVTLVKTFTNEQFVDFSIEYSSNLQLPEQLFSAKKALTTAGEFTAHPYTL